MSKYFLQSVTELIISQRFIATTPTACSQTPVWEHNCRETEFPVHYTPKQEFGSEQLKDIFQKTKLLPVNLLSYFSHHPEEQI